MEQAFVQIPFGSRRISAVGATGSPGSAPRQEVCKACRVSAWWLPVALGSCGFGGYKSRVGRVPLKCLRALSTRDPVKRGEILPAQPVPEGIVAPPYVADPDQVRGWWNSRIERKTDRDVEAMKSAGQLAHAALDLAADLIRPGITTEQMDKEIHTFICDHGAYPSDLQYKGFPKSVMISINEAPI